MFGHGTWDILLVQQRWVWTVILAGKSCGSLDYLCYHPPCGSVGVEVTLKEKYLSLSHPTHILIWLGVGLILFGLLFFAFGRVRDAWDTHEYNRTRAADIKKATDAEKQRDEALKVADQALQQRAEAIKQADEAHKQLVEAVQELNDASKTTSQKREIYTKIINSPAPVVAKPGSSTNDLCATARSLGIQSAACQ